jgi:hypothetical protein
MKTRSNKQVFYADYPLVALAAILFVGAGFLHQKTKKPLLSLSNQDTAINFNEDLFRYFSIGNKRLITDTLWVQTLIESDIDHYKGKDLNSWMYVRFKTIGGLDPMFYENFNWGGRYLSIIKDDLLGAVDIYKRGLRNFPNDYRLNQGIGFTYYFELDEPKIGLPYLEKIMDDPQAPPFYRSIVNKLRLSLSFDYDAALMFLQDLSLKTRDPVFQKKISVDIYAVKAERDLKCLNSAQLGCEKQDADGNDYVIKESRYYSAKFFKPYRLMKKGDTKKMKAVNTFE